jgi:hypothetical protein
MNTRNRNQFDASNDARDDDADTPIQGDTAIIEGDQAPVMRGPAGELVHIQVGARVYSSEGEAVAVVEITNTDTVGIRAGSPGRSIVVPASGIAWVSPDGKRVGLYASTKEVRDLSGANQSGAKHLEAQQPQTLARDNAAPTGEELPPGIVGPADTTRDARQP